MKWNIEDIKHIIPESEKLARKFGMSIALGGSVAHKFESNNDLDLVIFSLKTSMQPNLYDFLHNFISLNQLSMIGVVDHRNLGDEKLVYKLKTKDNKGIDLLFVNLKFSDSASGVKVLTRKTNYIK